MRCWVHRLLPCVGVITILAGQTKSALADTLYVSVMDGTNSSIDEISPGGHVSTFVSGLLSPSGLAFGPDGNLYAVAVQPGGVQSIYKISPTGSVSTFVLYANDIGFINGLAFDAQGNLYFAANDDGIEKISPSGNLHFFGDGDDCVSVAVDSKGDVASDSGPSGVIEETTPAGVTSTIGSVNAFSVGLAFDSQDNLYASTESLRTITEFPSSGSPELYASMGSLPGELYGMAFDSTGDLFVAEQYGDSGSIGVTRGGTIQTYATFPGMPVFIADAVPSPSPLLLSLTGIGTIVLTTRFRARPISVVGGANFR